MDTLKLRIKILTILLITFLFLPVGFLLVKNEYNKKLVLAEQEINLQNQIKADLEKYNSDYLKSVAAAKEDNIKKMADAKTTYAFLLQNQEKILSVHKKQVAVTDSAPTSSTYIANDSGGATTTVKKTVKKPITTRSTKTS